MRVDIVYFDAGSGHRTSAFGLQKAIERSHPGWQVRCLDLLEIVQRHRRFLALSKAGIGYFNWTLRKDRVFDLNGLIRLSLLVNDLMSESDVREIARFWQDDPPDAFISVTPMNNETLFRAVKVANPDAQYVIVPVDFEEALPRYWFCPRIDAHYLLGSERLLTQSRQAPIPPSRAHRLGGMIIDPDFYKVPEPPDNALEALDLDPHKKTVLVSFGGQGSILLQETADALAIDAKYNAIFLCGRNAEMKRVLEGRSLPYPKKVLGFSPEPPNYYYHLADAIIGKPGTMTITEAVVSGSPVVVVKSTGMHPVQSGNEQWVKQRGVGAIAATAADVPDAVDRVLAAPRDVGSSGRSSTRRGV